MKKLSPAWRVSRMVFALTLTSTCPGLAEVRLRAPASYLPGVPVLVRVEALTAAGTRDLNLWNAEATLAAEPASVTLSTNRVLLRNGLGSALVTCSGGGDFTLTATVNGESASRALAALASAPVTTVGGTLAGASTTWSGVVRLTNTVTVPVGHTLTIQSNTLVLINGVASGTAGFGLVINGAIQSLGSELHPVTITCASATLRWGQIRHNTAQPSLYRHTSIHRGGRAPGEGHTGQAPVIRPSNSTIVFESCNLTDFAETVRGAAGFGTPGKVMQASGSDVTFNDCILARARMGPEIAGTALLATHTWITDMYGTDDADGLYIHAQTGGQLCRLRSSVVAYGDDDGIDTLDSVVEVEGCVIRNWNNQLEDAKGVSVFNGATHLRRSVVTDCTVGVSAKTTSASTSARVSLVHCTLTGNQTNALAQYKPPGAVGSAVDYRITNSVLWGGDPVASDFAPTNFTIVYSDLSEPWAGAGNFNSDPRFLDAAARDFRLQAKSPCVNAGDPASPLDPDGSRADVGPFPFQAATNVLIAFGSAWRYLDDGSDQGTHWIARILDDSSWSNGVAQLGYGDGDEATVVRGLRVNQTRIVTTYFRRAIVLTDPAGYTNLNLRLLRDDGGVVYLNGVEVFRSPSMPAGTIAFDTLALSPAPPDNTIDTATINAALPLLVHGTNVIAVEVHQQSLSSSDMSFDFELVGITAPGGVGNFPPAVNLTSPANNAAFTEPATIAFAAEASDPDGTVSKVEFLRNGVKVGEDTTAPFSFSWIAVPAGNYALTAVATDDQGGVTTSPAVNVSVASANQPATNTLVALGSTWRYLDNGSDQGTNWSQLAFNDSAWTSGPAPMGYSSGNYSIATVVSFGPDQGNKYITTYFRQRFTVEDPRRVLGLNLSLLWDDGALVYLNGQEVHRVNMPAGAITSATTASGASDYSLTTTALTSNALAALLFGTNVLAVEIHQGNATSSDIVLNARLDAIVASETNARPIIVVTAPANGLTVAAPANLPLAAVASDSDGTVTNVAFFANGAKLADDRTEPFGYSWSSVPAGIYAITAAATDNVGWSSTSSVVSVTVSTNTAPPVVFTKVPAAGNVTSLTNVSVIFSKPVVGVDAADLLVHGLPASAVSGSGSNYNFRFPQPAYGTVAMTWASGHGITDVFTPPAPFNTNSPGANWQYTLLDIVPPVIAMLDPAPGSIVAALTSVAVTFSEPVTGVNAADLRINGSAATSVTGTGAGPYGFSFVQPLPGPVQIAWAAVHGIVDSAGNGFGGGAWNYLLDTNAVGIVLSEIMYHPSSENILEEYIELHNKGGVAVNLAGWRFSEGVQFTFPDVTLPANGYLVVCADPATFAAKYPTVINVVGPWTGFLNNSGEDIDLDDAQGNRVASVRYADRGDWAVRRRGPNDRGRRGWKWHAEHDGLGKSLELINPALPIAHGQNWTASLSTNGTPGRVNSVLTNNVAPLILEVRHFPLVPRSTEPVQVTARLLDEAGPSVTVTLQHRLDSTTTNAFTIVVMRDDGLGGDAVGGDGLYSATIPARANNAVVEFYVQAADPQGRVRTWPAPAIPAADGVGPSGQIVNALYQVDDTVYNPTNNQPLYKLIMTATEQAELAAIPCSSSQDSDAEMNGTFISLDTSGMELRYLAAFRNRGHGTRCASPPNYHIGFRSDERWKGVSAITLNSQNAHVQHLGSVLARKAGADGADSIAVQVRVNNAPRTPTYGAYAANEVVNSDWAERHHPLDPNGNLYRVIRDISPPDLNYRGEDYVAYANTYFKESNVPENYWGDLIGLLRVFGINNATPFTTENVRQVINVEQWMTHLAVMTLFGNAETGLNSGYNDDYWMYLGVNDVRAILLYWDLDSILGVSSLSATSGIYTSTANNGSGQAIERFLTHPDFNPLYLRTLKGLLETTFAQSNFNATVDQTLGGYVPASALTSIKNWMNQRRNHLLGSVLTNVPPASNAPVATVTGTPRSPVPRTSATLTVGGDDIVAYRFRLNNGSFGSERAVATTIPVAGLANGTNTVRVIGKNSTGNWQDTNLATVVSWVVNTAWPAVRLNEVLARNDSAVNHSGTFPDIIELFNESAASVNLSGLRLTDNPSSPGKFTFPANTSLAAGAYLVVYANDPDNTAGFHLGFNLDAQGEGVYLFDRVDRGGALLDAVEFGLQLPDLSIGRLGLSGAWVLCVPTAGAANTAHALGDPRLLRINEWLASGLNPYPDDFVELFNLNSLPVALDSLYLTDQPNGAPFLSPLAPLSFIAARGWTPFVADGNAGQGADHLNFKLSMHQGEIGLMASDGTVIDSIVYGPQQTDVSSGLCPDGSLTVKPLTVPTPGAPNACPFVPPPPQTISLLTISNAWRYNQSGTNLGTGWVAPAYDDSSWPSGPALLGFEGAALPEPIRTEFTLSNTKTTFYFRVRFTLPPDLNASSLELNHIIDDGAVVYLNGTEVHRWGLPSGAITSTTLATPGVVNATYNGPYSLSTSGLQAGENVLAVEVHQSSATSGDLVFGLKLDALIVTNSPALAGVLINEMLANNATIEEPDGRKPDGVEIYNPSAAAVDLAGMSLTDDTADARRWIFPAGAIVPALGFYRVQCDSDLPASTTNTGFGLKAEGGAVYLFHRPAEGGTLASAISYGLQAADWAIGRVPDGSTNWVLTIPNLGGPNFAATLGDASRVVVNEWMADPASGDDWFELFNPNPQPVDLSRFWLSDDLNSRQRTQLPALSFLGTGAYGFQKFIADGNTAAGTDHVGFGLRAAGEALAVSAPDGALIDGLIFGAQQPGVSEGRLPDGAAQRVFFPLTSTPGKPNFLPLASVVINEVFTHSDPPFEDAVEIYNPTGDDVNISGWYLSDSQNNLLKYRVPANTVVRAGGYVVFYENQFNAENPDVPFSFSSANGDEVYLSQASAPGVLTGFRAFAEFGAAENGVSFGRFPNSLRVDFTAMSGRSFGADSPASVEQFRTGTGLTNPYPKVGPVVINEVMYQPASTNPALEYIELHNLLGTPQPLYDPANTNNTWRLRKGVDFDFPPGVVIPAGGFIVLVGFNPQTDAAALADFRAAYGTNITLFGPFSGRLDNRGEALELQKPDAPQTVPGPDLGRVPRIVVDSVLYSPFWPWPSTPAGLGHSLQKNTAALYGNEPLNWTGALPTAGVPNGASQLTNTPPVLAPIGPRTVVEGLTLSFDLSATDGDLPPQLLSFSLDPGAPEGATLTSAGRFTWTPLESQGPGSYPLTFRVSDSGSPVLSDFEAITITVLETNSAPVLVPIGNKTVNEGAQVTFTATATDADAPAQTLTYSLDPGAPHGASIHPVTGAFTWTTFETNGPGSYPITVRVTDNGTPPRSASETLTLTVNEVNSLPVLTPMADRTNNELSLITFTATATDPDVPANALSFSLAPGAPTNANISAGGVFTWTPTEAQGPNTNFIRVVVTDNGTPHLAATQTVRLVVLETNSAPVLAPLANRNVTVGSLLSFTATATDADVPTNRLTFTLGGSVPNGAAISTGGLFTWTPTPEQVGSHTLRVVVTDDGPPSLSATQSVSVTVSNTALAVPLLSMTNRWKYHALGQNLATAWREAAYDDTAWASGAALLYNETTALPVRTNTWLSLTNAAGTRIVTYYFRTHFHLSAAPNGVTLVTSNLIDDGAVFYLNGVEAGRYNMPAGAVAYATQATSAVGDATNFAVVPLAAGALREGDNVLAVEVHQYGTSSSDVVFGSALWATVPGQTPIALSAQPASLAVSAGAPAQFSVGATGSAPQYQWFKEGASIPGAQSATLTIAAAQLSDAGSYTVRLTNYVSSVWSSNAILTVDPPPNTPPTLAAIPDQAVDEGAWLNFTAQATDAEAPPQTLAFSLLNAPEGAVIGSGSGVFAWAPNEGQGPGTYFVQVRVADDGTPPLAATQTVRIVVREVNLPPVFAFLSNRVVNAGTTVAFTVSASDADLPAQSLVYALVPGAPLGSSFNPLTRVFSWTPPLVATTQEHPVTFTVTDGGIPPLSATQTVQIVVVGAPRFVHVSASPEGVLTLEWESYPGRRYQVEATPSLATPQWTPLGAEVQADGATARTTDTVLPSQQRFYRVRLLD